MSRQFIEFAGESHDFAVNPESRTITGLAVPWNAAARNNGRRWRFERGSIKYSAVNRVKLLRDHDHSQALGKAVSITDTDAGLVVTFKISPGAAGDQALALAMDEVLDGLSVGVEWRDEDFGPDPLKEFTGGFLVKQAALREVSLTAVPAFDDSRLTSVRASDDEEKEPVMPDKPEDTAPATQPVTAPTPAPAPQAAPAAAPETTSVERTYSLAEIKAFRDMINEAPTAVTAQAAVADAGAPVARPVVDPTAQAATFAASNTAQVSEPLPYRFKRESGRYLFQGDAEHDFSRDVFGLANATLSGNAPPEGAQKRVAALIKAAFDVDTTDVAGLMPKTQRPDMWYPQRDYPTPLWDMINAGTTDGTPFELPKYDSSSGLVSAAVEGVEPAPGAFAVTTQTITPTALWGKVEITRHAIRRGGNPQTSGVIWEQMLRSYFEAREAAVATFLSTLTSAATITIPQTSGSPDADDDQAGVAALEAAIADLQFVRGGNTFTALAAHQYLYRMLARAKDDAGRPLLPIINPQNANGSSTSLYKAIDVAGTLAVPAYALGAASGTDSVNSWLFDPFTVRGWASNPDRLEWDFGATVQNTTRIPQLSMVTLGIFGDIALGNLDINGVRKVAYDPTGS